MGTELVELLKILLPAVLVLVGVVVVFNLFMERERRKERIELRSLSMSQIIPLRLQAYERCVLFLERISPENLIPRCEGSGKDLWFFHTQLQMEIRAEFEHNYSQQLYVSDPAWTELVDAKERVLALINQAAGELSPDSTGIDLGRKVLEKMINGQVPPTHQAIRKLKSEMAKAFAG